VTDEQSTGETNEPATQDVGEQVEQTDQEKAGEPMAKQSKTPKAKAPKAAKTKTVKAAKTAKPKAEKKPKAAKPGALPDNAKSLKLVGIEPEIDRLIVLKFEGGFEQRVIPFRSKLKEVKERRDIVLSALQKLV